MTSATTAPRAARLPSIDVLRGSVMVLMALDHVRDFVTKMRVQPEALAAHGSVALFATRWVTHFCAPIFALLAGVGVGLAMQRGRAVGEMRRFLVTRGLWLIVLDLVITPIGWRFSFDLLPAFALVLWALGLSMIVLAALVSLSPKLVAALALIVIAGHNLLDGVRPEALGAFAGAWHVLHVPGFAIPNVLLVAYPLVPWVAVVALGWALASLYEWEPARRRAWLTRAGFAAVAVFIVLRALDGYGDPRGWSGQATPGLTIASFLNVTKYPPSLDFLLMTLGPALVALAWLEGAKGWVADWLSVYGSVPLFYYVLHIPLVHLTGSLLAMIQSGQFQRIPAVVDPSAIPAWYGVGLPGVYLAWAVVVGLMYLPCRWYRGYRQRSTSWWVRYL